MHWIQSLDAAGLWRALSVLALGYAAWFFGRTLRRGRLPLIERIARVSDPEMTEPMRRYTRRLTALWCGYFVVAALLLVIVGQPSAAAGAWIWCGSAALFVGEHWLRPWFFPGRSFPGLVQQLRDTWSVWQRGKRTAD